MSAFHGDRASADRDRECLAYHEAGHACAVWRVGGILDWVAIDPAKPLGRSLDGGGCVQHSGPRGLSREEFIRCTLLIIYAGPEAQRWHDPTSDVQRVASGDYEQAENLGVLAYASVEVRASVLRMSERQARSFVQAEWDCIDALARALLRTPFLDGPAAIAVLRAAEAHRTARPAR